MRRGAYFVMRPGNGWYGWRRVTREHALWALGRPRRADASRRGRGWWEVVVDAGGTDLRVRVEATARLSMYHVGETAVLDRGTFVELLGRTRRVSGRGRGWREYQLVTESGYDTTLRVGVPEHVLRDAPSREVVAAKVAAREDVRAAVRLALTSGHDPACAVLDVGWAAGWLVGAPDWAVLTRAVELVVEKGGGW